MERNDRRVTENESIVIDIDQGVAMVKNPGTGMGVMVKNLGIEMNDVNDTTTRVGVNEPDDEAEPQSVVVAKTSGQDDVAEHRIEKARDKEIAIGIDRKRKNHTANAVDLVTISIITSKPTIECIVKFGRLSFLSMYRYLWRLSRKKTENEQRT